MRRLKSRLKKANRTFARLRGSAGAVLLVGIAVISMLGYENYKETHVDPTVYAPLLNTIAKGESQGNYNAYFGHAGNSAIRFTDMSVAEVLEWQEDYVRQGSPSSAVGKYQIIRPTLAGLVQKLAIEPTAKFDEKLQDRLAVALLQKRGVNDFMRHKLSRDQFAANLAQEWAALPKVEGHDASQSYYAGDGVNRARISINEVYKALAALHT